MKCPRCATDMQTLEHPDINVDRCPACQGSFLEEGELNVLATGLEGDIETCSVRYAAPDDRFGERRCHRCDGRPMQKVNLLALSDLVFDHCPACKGFFLDAGELEEMNELLTRISGHEGGDELRTYHDGRLVRVDRLPGVTSNLMGTGAPVTCIRVLVYFKEALGLNLRIHQQGFLGRVCLRLGLTRQQDIKTGDATFDAAFLVQGDDEAAVAALLGPPVRQALLAFVEDGPSVLETQGRLEVLDDRVAYTEGPYGGEIRQNVAKAAAKVITAATRIAVLLDR